jgi:hypothetical protein
MLMKKWPTGQGTKNTSARWVPPHPSGQARFWCLRPDPNEPNQTDSDTKMGRPGDALTPRVRHGCPGPSGLPPRPNHAHPRKN